jgi:cytochrome c nitrite reductase small subunit
MRLSLATLTALSLGIVLGLGAFTFHYAQGTSYFSDDPVACTNCHIMLPQYDSWQKASHHAVASCVDCHLPTDFVNKYLAKAENGFFHSKAFTFQDFHEPIAIKPKNAAILQTQCLHCHADLIDDVHHVQDVNEPNSPPCVHCHDSVGHGPTH